MGLSVPGLEELTIGRYMSVWWALVGLDLNLKC